MSNKPYIDKFIDKMICFLPSDMIAYIIQKYVYLPYNKLIIQQQKLLKEVMHRQLFFVSNIIYIDDNICVYVNNNQLIIHNNSSNINANIINLSLYALSQNISNLIYNSLDNNNTDYIVTNDSYSNYTNNIVHANNTLLLHEITERLDSIQNIQNTIIPSSTSNITIEDREYTNIVNTNFNEMRNVVLDTNHSNMNNISMYIMYI